MYGWIPEDSPRLTDENEDLVLGPAKRPCQGRQGRRLEGLVHVGEAPHPEVFEGLRPRPLVGGPLEHRLAHVLEPDRLHDLFPLLGRSDRAPELVHALHNEQHPLPEGRVLSQSAVFAADRESHVLGLEEPAGLELAWSSTG